ncbi:hypothetical protein G3I19_30005 [Streptomyces sp. SID10853]|uniref:hypothetical protein n=1 Tax=Streptomyces sp. SID10853 TaxID=2706028 RepID=UPI0013BF32D5|nr:hypothetical protein [Streptomyces sp. SID10853]NDZ82693.1 hypothetical protein [Streptomyces sp. SID10853]
MSFGQGGPSWGPGDPQRNNNAGGRWQPDGQGSGGTPDWAALADESAARGRRKKLLYIGGGVLATAVVGALVAAVVVAAGSGSDTSGKDLPSPEALPTRSGDALPSFTPKAPAPPPNPKDFISSSKKDKAPLSAATLFPGAKIAVGDHTYAKAATHRTTACASVTQGALGSVLADNGCGQVIRATFSKGGVAVTIGVAVFDTEAQAQKAMKQSAGGIASLNGAGVPTFCRNGSVCRRTANAYGRYAYFTVGGFTSGKNVTQSDATVFTAGDDVAEFTFRQIVARGQAQASAAATAPPS